MDRTATLLERGTIRAVTTAVATTKTAIKVGFFGKDHKAIFDIVIR